MKITGIKFLNLNSLKGEHEIRFDKPPFTESGIFAITGPTGAGKTTLLDAITVALYGKVHRHAKDAFEIMTRHTAESYAEVEFEVGLKSYRAKWSIRRSRGKADGQLQAQKMELAEIPGGRIIVEHPLNDVKEQIVKICGLDYNQFLRSVILSQGDFTRFLKADENERSELLEKITDTGIYSQISAAAYEKARTERVLLDGLKNKLENVVLLTLEEREACTTELKDLSAQEQQLKLTEVALRGKIEWLNALEKLKARRQELILRLSEDELYYATNDSRFEQLQKHVNALVHRPALAELQTIEKQQLSIETDLKQAQLEYPTLVEEEGHCKTSLAAAKLQGLEVEKKVTSLEPVLDIIMKKDILIAQAKSQLDLTSKLLEQGKLDLQTANTAGLTLAAHVKTLRDRISELSSWLVENASDGELDKEVIVFKQVLEQFKALQNRLEILLKARQEYALQIAQGENVLQQTGLNIKLSDEKTLANNKAIHELQGAYNSVLAGKTENELEAELREYPVLIHTAEQQLKLANNYQKLLQEQSALIQSNELLAKEEVLAKAELRNLQEEWDKATTYLHDLQQIYELEVKVQKYEGDRLMLEPAQPCPLCGSLHHPFVEGKYTSRVTESGERRNQQQEKLNLLKLTLDSQAIKINTLAHQLETGNKSELAISESVTQNLADFDLNNSKLPKPLDIGRADIIAAVIERKIVQQQNLQDVIATVKGLQLQLNGLEGQLSLQRETIAQEKNTLEQAGLTINFAEKQLKSTIEEITSAESDCKRLQDNASLLTTTLGIVFDAAQPDQVVAQMNNRYVEFKKSAQEINQLQLELRQKETEYKSMSLAIEEKSSASEKLRQQHKEHSEALIDMEAQRFELFGVKDPLHERAQLAADQKKYLAQIEEFQLLLQEKQQKVRIVEDRKHHLNTSFLATKQLFNLHLEKLTAKISEEGMGSVSELHQLFLPDDEAAEVANLQREAAQKIASGKSLLRATEKDLETELLKALTSDTKDKLQPLLEEHLMALDLLQQEKGKLNQIISEDEQLKIRHLEVAQQINNQQQEYDRFQKLSALIGSADGKKFSRFAQGLTLARLTELANRHLLRLSDRYSIFKSPEKDLDLQIVDHYQAEVIRPMSTLSGGESFLVSLALALGLSDLASRKVQINSLFIDEGFGTLDAETLDVAISALENLQASGKSIGIISHVEALKERIGTQIQLSREPGGTSKISLYSYGLKTES